MLTGNDIKSIISAITATPKKSGFEVFAITKTEPRLKKMSFYEKNPDNLREKMKDSVFGVLSEKYNSKEAEYVSVDRIADEQNKYFIIETNEEYNPFAVLETASGMFGKDDIKDTTGFAFSIRNGQKHIWAYQHFWGFMHTKKSKNNWKARLISNKEGVVFEELTDPVITFSDKIDLLIIENNIIARDYKLLQQSFGFHDYIRIRADKTIKTIVEKDLVANPEILKEYVLRENSKPKYAKKMLRISDSKVFEMRKEDLWNNIHKSERWHGKIKEENGQFVLDNYKQVEAFIDLLDERYTKSEITGTEYDTDVKQVALAEGTDS